MVVIYTARITSPSPSNKRSERKTFHSKQDAYDHIRQRLEDTCLHFDVWSELNLEYQMEQVGFFLENSGTLHGKMYDAYAEFYPDFGKKFYSSISYEQLVRIFPIIPPKVLDIMGKKDGKLMGDIKFWVSEARLPPLPPPLGGRSNRIPVTI